MAEQPNVDDLFPPQAKSLDELFPPDVEKERYRRQALGTSPVQDLIFGDTSVNPIARVLDAFGQGAKQSWGASSTENLSKQTADLLKINKQFDAWNEGQNSIIKAANEALFRPAAVQMAREFHDARALYEGAGAVFAGTQGAIEQIGKEVGQPQLGREAAATFEAFPTGFHGPTGVSHGVPVKRIEAMVEAENAKPRPSPTPHPDAMPSIHEPEAYIPHEMLSDLEKARELKVIGAGEDGYLGTAPSTEAPSVPPKPVVMPVDLFAEPRDTSVEAEPKAVEAAPEPQAAEAKPNSIAEDVAARLTAAGRPADEALASGQIIASHYEARAERFGGQLGTAEDLYNSEGAFIKSGDGVPPARPQPPIVQFRKDAAAIEQSLPDVADGMTRLWRGNRPGEVGQNPQFTDDLPGIALPFQKGYGGPLSYVDVSIKDLPKYVQTVGAATNAEFVVPKELAAQAKEVRAIKPTEPQLSSGAAEPIKTVNVTKSLRGRAAADPQTWSLYEFLASRGGLKADPELEAIFGQKRGPMVGGFGPLLRKNGMTLDHAFTVAQEEGYLPRDERSGSDAGRVGLGLNSNDLLRLIDDEAHGRKQYRETFGGPEKPYDPLEHADYIRSQLNAEVEKHGGKVDPALEDRVVQMVQKEGEHDVLAAYERAIMEDHDRNEALLDERRANKATADIAGHDAPDRGAASDSVKEFVDDSGYTWASEQEARDSNVREPSGHGAGDRTAAELELSQIKRGKINLRNNAKPIITLFKDANASTFIHETGHHWLEELMKDAEHPSAPADLKGDAIKVLDWLGVGKAADIKTSHHEKFARGFERYMMEGKAPNQALAGVFAKFRNWLTKIYQTVNRLKSPINDDIRGVFDRLLTMNPSEVKIEPEAAAKTFADIHELDAATHTAPEMAHPAAETIMAERDSVGARHFPEDQDARLKDTSDQAQRREAGNQQPASHANAAGPVTGEGLGAEAPGAIGAGGNEAAPSGAGTPKVDRTEPPVGAHDKFPDKAGNIRLDNLNTPEDLNQIIRQTAEDNGDFQNVRGPISDAQILDLAEAAGVDTAFIDSRKLGEAWTAPQIVALRRLLIQSAQSVHDLAVKAAAGAEADVMAYAQARARHQLIQERVSSVTAEAGRALRAFQSKFTDGVAGDVSAFLKDATGKTLFQLQQEAKFLSKLQTPQQTSKFVHDTASSPLRNAILEYYINALISGPVTHTRYIVSNAVNAIWTPLVEIPLASVVGKARQIAEGGEIDRVRFGEAGAQLYGMIKGSRDGISAAIEAFKTGVSPPLPTEKLSPHFAEASQAIPGPFGQIIRIPSRSVAGIHSFFKALRYEQNVQALAYRNAANEGLRGTAFENRVAELTTSPTEAMMTEATGHALKELYMSPTEYHSKMGGLVRFTNQNLAAKIVVPFMKIGSQITRNAFIERTPLGALDRKVRENLSSDSAAADFQAGKITAGMALMAASVGLCAEGMMTGDGPEDPAKRAVWLLSHTPASIQIGDINFKYGNTGPLGMLMRFAANTYETAEHMGDSDMATLAVSFFEGFAKSVLDETFLRGVKDALDAMFHPKEYGGRYIKSQITNWIPWSVGLSQVARQVDPFQRETHGIWQAAQAKIPYVSEGLAPRRDMFGEPMPNGGPLPAYANDPVVKAMDELHIGIGKIGRKIRGVELTDQQYDDLSRVAGRMAKTRLNAMVNIISNPNVPQAQRIELIHSAISSSREAARSLVMMQNQDIIKKATDAKLDKLRKGETVH